tara:strand:- start:114 stop:947 length:834 start_codon:yes stop_codon:yes gene_type:complete
MNIVFFGSSSFAAQDLIIDLGKKYNTYFFSRKKNIKKNFYHFDLNNKDLKLNKILRIKKIDYLFFFSSFVPIKENKSTWKQCRFTNVIGLIRLLIHLKVPIKKIILASSCSLYGHKKNLNNEENFLKPINGYSLSKLMQENILKVFCNKNHISFLNYRLGYVYGNKMNALRLVKRLLIIHKNKKQIKIFNKNLNLNLIHTKDIANLILKSFKKAEGTFNLTDPNKITLRSYYQILMRNHLNIVREKNNYSPKKFFSKFPNLKMSKFEYRINDFINEA